MRLVDRIAYINHDIDDALRAGVLALADLPAEPIAVLGRTGSQRIDTLVHDLVEHSAARGGPSCRAREVGGAMAALRAFMFERVYLAPAAVRATRRIEDGLRALFDHYWRSPELLPARAVVPEAQPAQRVIDYLAGMTDRFAIRAFEELEGRPSP